MNTRPIRLIAYAVVLLLAVFLAVRGFRKFNDSLTTGLEEEKSYSRHAMEYHRQHPDKRKGDAVLEVWSDADYIAQAVAKINPAGHWAAWSDELSYLPDNLRNRNGRPYCVIDSPPDTIVLWFVSSASATCNVNSADDVPLSNIQSGNLEFSGRSDYWIYILRHLKN
jgi:hypothetical protein